MTNKRKPLAFILLVAAGVVTIFALWAGNDFQALRSTEPPFQFPRWDMMYQTKLIAQEPSTFFADRKGMRNPVPGTFPREGEIYPFASPEEAEANLVNPIAAATADILARGKNRFETFCAACHSASGWETTEVVNRGMPKPPSLLSAKTKSYSDAKIFHIISKGQNIMPGYADKLTPEDRWKVVNYVRTLQGESSN